MLLKNAARNLWRKRARTLLTMSGIVIGVSLVSLVSVIGAVGRSTVNAELENMGLMGLSVTASDTTLLEQDALTTLRQMDGIVTAVPLMLETVSCTQSDGTSMSLMLCGIDSGEVQAIGLSRLHGSLIRKVDVASSAHVCVVDEAVARSVFGRVNVVGAELTMRVGGTEEDFIVIGVTKAGSMLLQNIKQLIPGMVYIPYTTLQQLTGRTDFDQFAVQLQDGVDETDKAALIERELSRVSGNGGVTAENLSAQKEQLSGLMAIVQAVLTVISAVSLVVAGLSIMTVMMVSVGERTREIGIKKALGASNVRILRDFLTESVMMSLTGGAAGVVIGGGIGWLGLRIVGVAPTLPLSILWLIPFAAMIGMVFGVYPAMKAAHLNPVEALRCE